MVETGFMNLPLKCLTPFPLNVRVELDEEKLVELAETVKANGVLEPLIVRPSKAEPGKYEVVCGYRRFKAAEMAGLEAVPCIVKDLADDEAMEVIYIENEQREDISDYERGRWFKLLMEKFPNKYPDLNSVAKSFGYKAKATISQIISHYEFIDKIKQAIPPNLFTRVNSLPEGITREIRRAPLDAQPTLVKAYFKSLDKGTPLSVRDIAKMVEKLLLKQQWETQPASREASTEAEKPTLLEQPLVRPPEAVTLGEKPALIEMPEPFKAEKLEETIGEECKRIIAEKERAKFYQRLDQASRIYLLMTNFYPEPLVELVSCHLDFSPYTEDKAINLFKGLLETVLTDLTEGWKHIEKIETYLNETIAWQ